MKIGKIRINWCQRGDQFESQSGWMLPGGFFLRKPGFEQGCHLSNGVSLLCCRWPSLYYHLHKGDLHNVKLKVILKVNYKNVEIKSDKLSQ